MIMAGVERFLIELIRVNTKYVVAGIPFTQAEMISVIMVLGGAALIITLAPTVTKKQGLLIKNLKFEA
jgi:phosphatidylglycerol:prolipoprotein diacylglycerol transferase